MTAKEALTTIRKNYPYQEFDLFRTLEKALTELEAIKKRTEKVEELLVLYRLQQEFKERYNTSVRLLDQQECLDHIREIAEEIYLKEKEIEEMETISRNTKDKVIKAEEELK